MTKKDYELIARVIQSSNLDIEDKVEIANYFARELSAQNPRFNVVTFMNAATGVKLS